MSANGNKHRILQLDAGGQVLREIGVGAEISGHVFVEDYLYVLRGTGAGWRELVLGPS